MNAYMGNRATVPIIFNLGTRWRQVVNFTAWLLGKNPDTSTQRGWNVCPRMWLSILETTKFSSPSQDLNTLSFRSYPSHYQLYRTHNTRKFIPIEKLHFLLS